MYKLTFNELKNKAGDAIIRLSDNAFIPFDEANTDYQAFLKFLADGGQPLPADEVTL